jgi:hypothetical protein
VRFTNDGGGDTAVAAVTCRRRWDDHDGMDGNGGVTTQALTTTKPTDGAGVAAGPNRIIRMAQADATATIDIEEFGRGGANTKQSAAVLLLLLLLEWTPLHMTNVER